MLGNSGQEMDICPSMKIPDSLITVNDQQNVVLRLSTL